MALVNQASGGVNSAGELADDYQQVAADMTSRFDEEGRDALIAINDITDDPAMMAFLERYAGDDSRLSFAEYSRAMADFKTRTANLTSVQVLIAETMAKISETIASVAKYF